MFTVKRFSSATILVALCVPYSSFAQPIEWSVASGGNGHFYETIVSGATFTDAESLASQRTFMGLEGHLVTITSQAENDFITGNIDFSERWIGASDRDQEGEWRWIAGPETGELFWDSGVEVGFSTWSTNEPNDFLGGEDFAHFSGTNWNDVAPNSLRGYIVEYSVPEPTSACILAVGTLIAGRRRRRLA